MKKFNTTAVCIPAKHYMVDLSKRVEEIKKLVDAGEYFTINRARQYGVRRQIVGGGNRRLFQADSTPQSWGINLECGPLVEIPHSVKLITR